MTDKRPARSLSCELSSDGALTFKSTNPVGPEMPMTMSGTKYPNGNIVGELDATSADGKPYSVHTGEPGDDAEVLEYETLPRIAKICSDALKCSEPQSSAARIAIIGRPCPESLHRV